ncbi:MAG: leucine-rich repeat domain-containing protein [Paludibacteraceae bacterium]|nr:leucine-rich repeat domain-containing protein [Paludibacteraceae bacterium]
MRNKFSARLSSVVIVAICMLLLSGCETRNARLGEYGLETLGLKYWVDGDNDSYRASVQNCKITFLGYVKIPSYIKYEGQKIPVTGIKYLGKKTRRVSIPETVIEISSNAFSSTPIYNNPKNWENGVLYVNNNLIAVDHTLSGSYTIKEGTRIIADAAFSDCLNLDEVILPDGIITIGKDAFKGCQYISEIKIPHSTSHIGSSAFAGCTALSEVFLPDSLKTIQKCTFENCGSLEKISIPALVEEIKEDAFRQCSSLRCIELPDNLRRIGDCAFASCKSLKSIDLPEGIWFVGKDVFYNSGIYNAPSNWSGNVLYVDHCLVDAKYSFEKYTITVKQGTKIIADYAFDNDLGYLTSIYLPDGLHIIGEYAFSGVRKLRSVRLPSDLWYIGKDAFSGTSLSSINIPKTINTLPMNVFSACDFKKIFIPDNIEYIGDRAFEYCRYLESITIPRNIKYVGAGAFTSCDNLTDIKYDGTCEEWKNVSKGESWNGVDYILQDPCPATYVQCIDGIVNIE